MARLSPNSAPRPVSAILFFAVLAAACGGGGSVARGVTQPASAPSKGGVGDWPGRFVWAWERPEDLAFLPPGEVGVAFLAATVALTDQGFTLRARRQPLKLPATTALLPVLRLEIPAGVSPALDSALAEEIAERAVRLVAPDHLGLQVDFDATLSQRRFYGELLGALRRRLPADRGLSVAGLASWCQPDSWLEGPPIDEFVPMLYRMGRDGPGLRARLAAGRPLPGRLCRDAVGLSADEPLPALPAVPRIYLYHPRPWTPEAFAALRDAAPGGLAP